MASRSTSAPGGPDAAGAYAVLGVAESAGAHELARAYWRQARRLHPDVNPAPDAAEQFSALSRAYRSALQGASRRGEPSGVERGNRFSAPQSRHDLSADVWLVAGPVRVTPLQQGDAGRRREEHP